MGLRARLNQWATRVLGQERDELQQEVNRLKAEVKARGGPIKPMTDREYRCLMKAAKATGRPEDIERIKELAREHGRVVE